MSKRQHDELIERRRLQDAGWQVNKRDAVAFNSGSETDAHLLAKALVAKVLKDQGWRVDTEVKKDGVGEIDVIAYGNGVPFCVEVETDLDADVIAEKRSRYVENEPFRDVFSIDPRAMPADLEEAREWVEAQL